MIWARSEFITAHDQHTLTKKDYYQIQIKIEPQKAFIIYH